MRHCLPLKSSTSSSATAATHSTCLASEGNSSQGTPTTAATSAAPSPTVNLSREYADALKTNSCSEIRSTIHIVEQWDSNEANHHQQLLLSQVLRPNREVVEEILRNAKPTTLTDLVSAYFEHSEKTCHLLLVLYHGIHHAHCLYSPIHDLVDGLPSQMDSMTQFQCNHAFEVFHKFDQASNPFPCPDSHNFQDMRECFSQLKQQVDHLLHKSRERVRRVQHVTTGSAVCLIGTVFGVALSAIIIATHALAALVAAAALSPACLPSNIVKREIVHMAQLDTAAKSAYVLHNDLDTIDRLVARLYTSIEGDKFLVRLGLNRGTDKHPIYEVAKQLGKNQGNVLDQLTDLEEHICLCFAAINRARSNLLQEIDLQRTYSCS